MLQVLHSQRLRATPLKPWIIAEKEGKILSGHCDCMAGLGETCTHVSALLFYVDTTVRIRDSKTVTEEANQLKGEGNEHIKMERYEEAIESYDGAIEQWMGEFFTFFESKFFHQLGDAIRAE